jgi:hypothetical protein
MVGDRPLFLHFDDCRRFTCGALNNDFHAQLLNILPRCVALAIKAPWTLLFDARSLHAFEVFGSEHASLKNLFSRTYSF